MVFKSEFLRWMSRGNSRSHNNSWIGYCRLSRTMITGYKKKKLGRPSEKLSGDVPRAGWRAVIISEVIFPIFFAILLIIAYMFVKSFPVAGQTPPSPLIRITVVSIGPIVWNAAVLLVLFLISLFLGPMLDSCCVRFGAVMASIAHVLGTIGMIGFFEFFVSLPILFEQLHLTVFNFDQCSGSSSFGTHRMLSLVSSRLWRSSVPFTKY
jgi:1,3-beta-glucan synthase